MVALISSQKYNLLKARRLPLVLDLDDTLVRLVGNERSRYVSDVDAAKGIQAVIGIDMVSSKRMKLTS